MAKHNRTRDTVNSIEDRPRVEWSGTVGAIPVGFNLKEGGMPSIFLMYGTARHAPANQYGRASGSNGGMQADRKLYNDIYGAAVKRRIGEKQQEILDKAIKKRMGE